LGLFFRPKERKTQADFKLPNYQYTESHMSWGATTMNLHSQLISSNGNGSFGGQGVPDFFPLEI
jgi:hypothetical protein